MGELSHEGGEHIDVFPGRSQVPSLEFSYVDFVYKLAAMSQVIKNIPGQEGPIEGGFIYTEPERPLGTL